MNNGLVPTPPRILRIPENSGRLLVCTDLHGNLDDFRQMVSLFCERYETDSNSHLIFTGDMIHGPDCAQHEWPEYLGSYYKDRSVSVVDEFIELEATYPGHVHCLLGNHEHSHIGGPHTPKFWPDETAHLEKIAGVQRTAAMRELFDRFYLVATTRSGVAITHAAPNVTLLSAKQFNQLRYGGYEDLDLTAMQNTSLLGRFLWSRSASTSVVEQFLRVIALDEHPLHIVVYGHDIVWQGYDAPDDRQLVLSTSFGLNDPEKHYLDLDLSKIYRCTDDFQPGIELKRLYEGSSQQDR